jgi:hypothetical protein
MIAFLEVYRKQDATAGEMGNNRETNIDHPNEARLWFFRIAAAPLIGLKPAANTDAVRSWRIEEPRIVKLGDYDRLRPFNIREVVYKRLNAIFSFIAIGEAETGVNGDVTCDNIV